mgnify:FL=1
MYDRADGNEAKRQYVARADRVRTEDTQVEAVAGASLHRAVALHRVAGREAVGREDVAEATRLGVLDQCNVRAAAGIVLDADDALLACLPAVKVDHAQTAAVTAAAAAHRDVAVVVAAAGRALSDCERTHGLAVMQTGRKWVAQPANRRRERLERLELVVRPNKRRNALLSDAKARGDRLACYALLCQLALVLLRRAAFTAERLRALGRGLDGRQRTAVGANSDRCAARDGAVCACTRSEHTQWSKSGSWSCDAHTRLRTRESQHTHRRRTACCKRPPVFSSRSRDLSAALLAGLRVRRGSWACVMVLLTTSDNEHFTVDRDVAERSVLIKQMIEDIGETDQPIPLPNVSSSVLTKVRGANAGGTELTQVLEYCSHHRNDPPVPADDTDEMRRRATDISEWDAKFIQVDQEMLFEIILAANYLDIKSLLDIGCKTVYVAAWHGLTQRQHDQGQAAGGDSQAVQHPQRLYA